MTEVSYGDRITLQDRQTQFKTGTTYDRNSTAVDEVKMSFIQRMAGS